MNTNTSNMSTMHTSITSDRTQLHIGCAALAIALSAGLATGQLVPCNEFNSRSMAVDAGGSADAAPSEVAVGDLNGDGLPDAVMAVRLEGVINVFLNTPEFGTFGLVNFGTQAFAAGNRPESVAIGDVDGDGDNDIVVVNTRDGALDDASVLLNNGDATFAAPQPYTTGDGTVDVALGDIDGDGDLDIATADSFSDTVTVLRNNGNGTFAPRVTFSVGEAPRGVALGDTDGDGDLDIVVANAFADSIGVLVNNGSGSFGGYAEFAAGDQPRRVALGDMDGDGDLDAVTANEVSDDITLMKNDGSGVFAAPLSSLSGDRPRDITLADMNTDGALDAITANEISNTASVLLNSGTGSFGSIQMVSEFLNEPIAVATGDINVDGQPDLLVANLRLSPTTSGGNIVVHQFGCPNPPVKFCDSYDYQLNSGIGLITSIVSPDVNADGLPDVVLLGRVNVSGSAAISVALNNADGTFGEGLVATANASGFSFNSDFIFESDFNGDGFDDVGYSDSATGSGGTVSILLSNGDGTFPDAAPQFTFQATMCATQGIVTTDFNGDGVQDLAAADCFANSPGQGDISIHLGNGDGTFQTPLLAEFDFFIDSTGGQRMVSADFNGDGHADLAVRGEDTNQHLVAVLLGNGNGTFQTPLYTDSFLFQTRPLHISAGDVTNDGAVDLVVIRANGLVSTLVGNGDGTFELLPGGTPISFFSVGNGEVLDMNGDGRQDLVVQVSDSRNSVIFLGNGNGTYDDGIGTNGSDRGATWTDFDLDGDIDIGRPGPFVNGFSINWNSLAECVADLDANCLLDLTDINLFIGGFIGGNEAADLNGDRLLDLGDVQLFATSFVAGCP